MSFFQSEGCVLNEGPPAAYIGHVFLSQLILILFYRYTEAIRQEALCCNISTKPRMLGPSNVSCLLPAKCGGCFKGLLPMGSWSFTFPHNQVSCIRFLKHLDGKLLLFGVILAS